jgi:hypothetical protein
MKSLSKKIVAIALGGFLLMGIGSTVIEASPFPADNPPQVESQDQGDRHDDPPPPPKKEKKEKKHHHNKDRNRVIIGGAMIGAAIDNEF